MVASSVPLHQLHQSSGEATSLTAAGIDAFASAAAGAAAVARRLGAAGRQAAALLQRAAVRGAAAMGATGAAPAGANFANSDASNEDVVVICVCVFFVLVTAAFCSNCNLEDILETIGQSQPDSGSEKKAPGEQRAERSLYDKVFHFPTAHPSSADEHTPAIVPHMLGALSQQLPLLVPIGPLYKPGRWLVQIASSHQRRPLFEAGLVDVADEGIEGLRDAVGLGRHRRAIEIYEADGQRRPLASIDSTLQIKGRRRASATKSDGRLAPFGQLERIGHRFVLNLRRGGRRKYVISRSAGCGSSAGITNFTVLWYSEDVDVGKLVGQSEKEHPWVETSKGRLIATATIGKGGHADFLEVFAVPDADAVLASLCVLGVLAFDADLAVVQSSPAST